jgi:hypothetical protein
MHSQASPPRHLLALPSVSACPWRGCAPKGKAAGFGDYGVESEPNSAFIRCRHDPSATHSRIAYPRIAATMTA